MGSILTWLSSATVLTLISSIRCENDQIEARIIDTDIISVKLPDKVTYTLMVVLISYLFKMIFDIVYRLRKMECRWGSLCFCKSQFKDDDDRDSEPMTCPACSPSVHVNISGDSNVGLTERRARLNNIIVDSDK